MEKGLRLDLVVCGHLIHDNKLLLIHHKKLDMWLPPGGHIDKDETPDDTLIREFKEEVNLDIEILNRNDVDPAGNIISQLALPFYCNVHSVGDHAHSCSFYLCRALKNEIKKKDDEVNDFRWFTKEELNDPSVPVDVRNIGFKAFEALDRLKRQ
ncbi:NUDIX domain-containing protein [Candidatus Woesearchaeota archaeon]|nr:NUDIX domain-containing protein [Candidatus Woesearchaeota archaeon]